MALAVSYERGENYSDTTIEVTGRATTLDVGQCLRVNSSAEATIDKLILALEFMAHPGGRVRREACYSFVRMIVRYLPAAQQEGRWARHGTGSQRSTYSYIAICMHGLYILGGCSS